MTTILVLIIVGYVLYRLGKWVEHKGDQLSEYGNELMEQSKLQSIREKIAARVIVEKDRMMVISEARKKYKNKGLDDDVQLRKEIDDLTK